MCLVFPCCLMYGCVWPSPRVVLVGLWRRCQKENVNWNILHKGMTFLLFSKREKPLTIKAEGESSLSLPSLILLVPVSSCFSCSTVIFWGVCGAGAVCPCVLLRVPAWPLRELWRCCHCLAAPSSITQSWVLCKTPSATTAECSLGWDSLPG